MRLISRACMLIVIQSKLSLNERFDAVVVQSQNGFCLIKKIPAQFLCGHYLQILGGDFCSIPLCM